MTHADMTHMSDMRIQASLTKSIGQSKTKKDTSQMDHSILQIFIHSPNLPFCVQSSNPFCFLCPQTILCILHLLRNDDVIRYVIQKDLGPRIGPNSFTCKYRCILLILHCVKLRKIKKIKSLNDESSMSHYVIQRCVGVARARQVICTRLVMMRGTWRAAGEDVMTSSHEKSLGSNIPPDR